MKDRKAEELLGVTREIAINFAPRIRGEIDLSGIDCFLTKTVQKSSVEKARHCCESGMKMYQNLELFRLPAVLADLRRRHGWTQDALARAAGMDAPRLCALERGRFHGPGEQLLNRLADALGLSDNQRQNLVRLAAQDRVVAFAGRHLPEDWMHSTARHFDALRLLGRSEAAALFAVADALVRNQERAASFLDREEDAMR